MADWLINRSFLYWWSHYLNKQKMLYPQNLDSDSISTTLHGRITFFGNKSRKKVEKEKNIRAVPQTYQIFSRKHFN